MFEYFANYYGTYSLRLDYQLETDTKIQILMNQNEVVFVGICRSITVC